MTPKERQLAAIRREPTDRISADTLFIYNFVEVAEVMGIDAFSVWDELGIDGRLALLEFNSEFTVPPTDLNRTTWSTTIFDETSSQYGTQRTYPLEGAKSKRDIEDYEWPDLDKFNFQGTADFVSLLGDDYAMRGPMWVPVFCKACDLFGMEEAMIKMMNEPDIFEAALDKITDIHVATCERFLDSCGDKLPIFCAGDDFATQRGLMISPEKWRRFIKPRLDRIIEVGRKRGKIIWFHSCGDVTSVLPDLIEMGVDVWETVQLHTLPFSPEELKKRFGNKLTFFGGINSQRLPFAKPEAIKDEVYQCIEALGKGGGYICGADHTINNDIPPENTIELYEAVRSFRKEGYTS